MLEVRGLNAFYGDFQALFDIGLSLGKGETLAVVGANGAGKTSLLASISGLVTATGTINLAGRDLSPLGPPDRARLGVALSPEGRRMFQSLSVRENLLMGGNVGRNGHWTLATVTELFPILAGFMDRPAALLSGGQQQMVAIGRALMANPSLLLLDEVSLGLAPIVAQEVHAALARLRGQSETMVMLVEQDVARALNGSDRFICLLEGRCVLEGNSGKANIAALSRAYFGEDA